MHQIAETIFKVNTANGSGSSFYLKKYNIFVTNFHVVKGAKTVSLESRRQDRFVGHVVMADENEDIAIIKTNEDFSGLPELDFSELSQLNVRDEVYVLGYPYGMPYTETQGIVSSPRQLMNGKYYIQTDAPVNPGNSGGPLVNANGQIIGITTSKFTEADNMGFAVPVNILAEVIEIYSTYNPAQYSIVCSGCKTVIEEAGEYCNNCGGNVDPLLFEEQELSALSNLIEEELKTQGINPILARAGYEYWSFHSGSSLIRIFVYNKSYVYATSPINKMMSKNMPELLNYLLSPAQLPYKLGVYEGEIYLSYRTHISDVFNEKFAKRELERLVKLSEKADQTDNFLLETFGCPLSVESKIA